MKNLYVDVFRSGLRDCTNHGLSSRVNSGYIFIDCTREEAIAWCESNNVKAENSFYLVRRELFGERADYVEPLIKPEGCPQTMGGNFVYTSDSRWGRWCGTHQPLPVHDRFDTWSDFNAMTI